jgi:hypothetical protein
MDATPTHLQHLQVRVLAHIKKLDDCFGQFLVRVTCQCGAVREIKPEALARLVGWSVPLEALAQRMRCSHCGEKAAEFAAASSRPVSVWMPTASCSTVRSLP